MSNHSQILRVVLAALILLGASCCSNVGKTYTNPLDISLGDPFILRDSTGMFYMYGTSDSLLGFKSYSSSNLKDWKDEGVAYQGAGNDSWTKDCFWAPEVYQMNGRYYMLFSATWKHNPTHEGENFRIGVAVADKPTGPFKELYNHPIVDPGYPIIDANLLFDDDGKVYLYYSRCCYKHPVESEISAWAKAQNIYNEVEESWIYGVELKSDLSGAAGNPVVLLTPPKTMSDSQNEWESRSVTAKEANRRWTEGSFIIKRDGTYYMTYSANFFGGENYAVGYATSASPLGPFVKSGSNPILQKNSEKGGDVTGTGHSMILSLPDGSYYMVYHGRTSKTGNDRKVFIDRMEFKEDGQVVVHGPTATKQPLPKTR
jgi:beta-xylosidase